MKLQEFLEQLKDLPIESTVVIDDGQKYYSIADIRLASLNDPQQVPIVIISI